MLISVILPVYNRETQIIRALESVIKQQCVNFDVWVIDDGSTDSTAKVVKAYIAENFLEQKVFYHFIENSGVSIARNTGIELSKGEWIAFLDSDDEWLPEKLRLQSDHVKANPKCQLVHSDEIWIRNGKRINQMKKHKKSGGDIFLRALELCLISPSATLLKRDLLIEVGVFDPVMTVCEDYDLWLRICSRHRVCYVDIPLINKYGGATDQLSRKYKAMDYWRILSIDKLLKSVKLKSEWKQRAIEVLVKKCEILLAGYTKHQNFEHFDDVKSIYELYN